MQQAECQKSYPTVFHCCFFFQAEDGIRDTSVTGVQTCALPIYRHVTLMDRRQRLHGPTDLPRGLSRAKRVGGPVEALTAIHQGYVAVLPHDSWTAEIGRASCRERCGARSGRRLEHSNDIDQLTT